MLNSVVSLCNIITVEKMSKMKLQNVSWIMMLMVWKHISVRKIITTIII